MGPASSREDEEDPTAADNGLAIAIPFKTSENHDELQQPPEETVGDLLFVFYSWLQCSKWAGICRYSIPELIYVPEIHTGIITI
jgi:hypothetical protein